MHRPWSNGRREVLPGGRWIRVRMPGGWVPEEGSSHSRVLMVESAVDPRMSRSKGRQGRQVQKARASIQVMSCQTNREGEQGFQGSMWSRVRDTIIVVRQSWEQEKARRNGSLKHERRGHRLNKTGSRASEVGKIHGSCLIHRFEREQNKYHGHVLKGSKFQRVEILIWSASRIRCPQSPGSKRSRCGVVQLSSLYPWVHVRVAIAGTRPERIHPGRHLVMVHSEEKEIHSIRRSSPRKSPVKDQSPGLFLKCSCLQNMQAS